MPPISTQHIQRNSGVKESEAGRGEDGCTAQGWEDDDPHATYDPSTPTLLAGRHPHGTLDTPVVHLRPLGQARWHPGQRHLPRDIPALVTTHPATAPCPHTLLHDHGPVTLLCTAEGLTVLMKGCLTTPLHDRPNHGLPCTLDPPNCICHPRGWTNSCIDPTRQTRQREMTLQAEVTPQANWPVQYKVHEGPVTQ